jgi:nicotinate dehydrogenase subunit B
MSARSRRASPSLSRRRLLQAAGALIVAAGGPLGTGRAGAAEMDGFSATKPALHPAELDSWIAIGRDGKVTAFFGKIDAGQAIDVAVAQIVAEELDVAFGDVRIVMGDSARTINQGGASNSTGVRDGAQQLRNAAAEARRLLLDAAARQLGVPVETLAVTDGLVTAAGDATKRVSYAELVGGRYFSRPLGWNGQIGNPLKLTGKASPKKPADYKIVGRSLPRADTPGKVFATTEFVTDIRLPGMLHARVVRPPVARAAPLAIDERSLDGTGARLVRVEEFVAVVAEKEWDAVRGAQALKVQWQKTAPAFPAQADLYDHIRRAKPVKEKVEIAIGDVDAAFAGAAKSIAAEYEWPFQSHSSMGPACAIVALEGEGATLYTGSQKPHYAAQGVADMLGIAAEKVHAVWVRGPSCYGRNDADDTAAEAAVIAKATGRPVRLQGMRHDATQWDPKGPAGIHRARAAFDGAGNVLAYEFFAKGLSTLDVDSHGGAAKDLWIGQLLGADNSARVYAQNVPSESYAFPAKRMGWQCIAPLLALASPLRSSHFRDTTGPQLHFASESFIDEMAYATVTDPVALRLKHIAKDRHRAVVQAAVEKAGWIARQKPRLTKAPGGRHIGQGIAYAERGGTLLAIVAEIEVDPASGRIWARKFTVAHDCGLIINPAELRRVIEGNIVQAMSRALFEEVMFDRDTVTSRDWASYPIAEIGDAPETIDIVLIDRPDQPPTGAGEPSSRPVAGALANALYDATGLRLRRAPFTPERVKAGLAALG